MAKPADVSSKRLVSLAPTAWVQWLTGDTQAEALELLGNEFQFASRANDVLIKVHSAQHGTYLVANEIQLRVDPRMPLRMRTYVALIEERYDLPVYPVVVNILQTTQPVASEHRGTFMGLSALQQYRVINLWELDARAVLEGSMPTLLPFVPIMRGGDRVDTIRAALYALQSDANLADLDTFLGFMAKFVLDSKTVSSIMRWNMATLRENPWYAEILAEGREEGREVGREEGREAGREEGREEGREGMLSMIQRAITLRFGPPDAELLAQVHPLSPAQLVALFDVVMDASSLNEVTAHLAATQSN